MSNNSEKKIKHEEEIPLWKTVKQMEEKYDPIAPVQLGEINATLDINFRSDVARCRKIYDSEDLSVLQKLMTVLEYYEARLKEKLFMSNRCDICGNGDVYMIGPFPDNKVRCFQCSMDYFRDYDCQQNNNFLKYSHYKSFLEVLLDLINQEDKNWNEPDAVSNFILKYPGIIKRVCEEEQYRQIRKEK